MRSVQVGWVPITQLSLDRYTRPVSEVKVNRMLERGLMLDALGTISVSQRSDGRYMILDGHHRVQASRKWGLPQMLSRIYVGKTYQEEALLFRAFNTTNRPTALDRFRARLEEGEETALDIQRILNRHGLAVGLSGPAHGTVQSVGAIDKLYGELGPIGLDRVTDILHRAWGSERKAWVQPMVEGMRQFWARYQEEVDIERLITQLKLHTPEQILAQAGLVALKSAAPGALVGRTLVERYNQGLRKRKLSDWVDHPGRRTSKGVAEAQHLEPTTAQERAAMANELLAEEDDEYLDDPYYPDDEDDQAVAR